MPTPTFHQLKDPIVGKDGNPTDGFKRVLQEWQSKLSQALTILGQISSTTQIQGRTEGIGTTVGHVDNSGILLAAGIDFSRTYTGKHLGNIPDDAVSNRNAATVNQKTGGDRGFTALDVNSRLADSFRANPVDVSNTPTSATTLSNDGVGTIIPIAASINQFSPGGVSYNSGTVDPGTFGGPNYVIGSDPTFSGGAIIYSTSLTPQSQTASKGNVPMGSITTVLGATKTGGGSTGGTGGRAGGRGYVL